MFTRSNFIQVLLFLLRLVSPTGVDVYGFTHRALANVAFAIANTLIATENVRQVVAHDLQLYGQRRAVVTLQRSAQPERRSPGIQAAVHPESCVCSDHRGESKCSRECWSFCEVQH